MADWQQDPITGTAAGVPFTALPPAVPVDGPAPLVVTWHMLDAPRTDAAFAAALPLAAVPAWRVHLGLPLCGARARENGIEAIIDLARQDAVLAYFSPMVRQAVQEFPSALAELRDQFPVDNGPIGIVGGSLGGAVAMGVLAGGQTPVRAAAVVNGAVRARSIVGMIEGLLGHPYPWTAESAKAADELDFVARAADVVADTPVLVVSGLEDEASLQVDAAELVAALRARYSTPDHAQLEQVPGLAHPLADEPGLEPAPQLPHAKVVDEALTQWFLRHLTAG